MERTQVDNIVSLAADIAGNADQIDEIIVVYTRKGEHGAYSMDNGLTASQGVFLCQLFTNWLLNCINATKK